MRMPLMPLAACDNRCNMSGKGASRCDLGTKFNVMRPVFNVVFGPSTPMKELRLCTAGSLSNTAAKACCFSDMAANDVACVASVMTCTAPVSCNGKKPLGMAKYAATVATTVKPNTAKVCQGRFNTLRNPLA